MSKVLIVDDSEVFTRLLSAELIKRGHDTRAENDPQKGLESAKKTVPDIIVLDIKMPQMSGITFLLEMRRERKLKKIPVLIASEITSFDKMGERTDLGVCDYLVKSDYSIEQIAERVESYLGK